MEEKTTQLKADNGVDKKLEMTLKLRAVFYNKADKIIEELIEGDCDLSEAIAMTHENTHQLGIAVIEEYYQLLDAEYSASRDRHRVLIKNKTKTRTLVTEMGNMVLRRQLYFDKVEKRYFFAVDEHLKLEKYSRVEKCFQAELVKNAALTSFGRASEIAGGKVSRQTVFNISTKLKNYNIMSEKTVRKDIEDIYIEADEDHIHMNDGNPGEVKLAYVHEGRESDGVNRKKLINRKYFSAVDDDPDTIWNDVGMYISEHYNVKGRIHVSGDGAAWIKAAQKVFPKAIYHLDKFHVCKSITESSYGNKKFSGKVFRAVRNKDSESLKKLYSAAYHSTDVRSRQKKLHNTYLYLMHNFNNIDFDNSCCSAEGHVSHILSARMSSRPMGWSRSGAERMAKLRTFLFNGGNFKDLIKYGKTEDPCQRLLCGQYSMRIDSRQNGNTSDEIWAKAVGISTISDRQSDCVRRMLSSDKKLY